MNGVVDVFTSSWDNLFYHLREHAHGIGSVAVSSTSRPSKTEIRSSAH